MFRTVSVAAVVLPASAYDEQYALKHAYLATAAYCSYPHMKSNTALTQWNCGPPCDHVPGIKSVFAINAEVNNDGFVYGGIDGDECFIAFRGTTNLAGWETDLKSLKLLDMTKHGIPCEYNGKACYVGDGFLSAYESMKDYIVGNLTAIGCDQSKPLTVGGHSLGAAIAALAMFDMKGHGYTVASSYTFGQPRVGDDTFAAAFDRDFGSINPFRITHRRDPVVHLPSEGVGFKHVAREVFYAGDVSGGYRICDESGEDPKCSDSNSVYLIEALLDCAGSNSAKCDHLTYMTKLKTIFEDGESCTEPSSVVSV